MIKRILSFLLALAVSCTLFVVSAEESGDALTLKNANFSLSLNPKDGTFIVENLKNGNRYFSNPEDTGEGFNKETLGSTLTVEYFTAGSERITLNSLDHSSSFGNLTAEKSGNSITVTYIFGKFTVDKSIVPQCFSVKEFEELLENDSLSRDLFEKRYKKTEKGGALAEQYPSLKKQDLYILHQYTPDYDVETIYKELQSIGFTQEKLREHNEKHSLEVEYSDNIQITVPLKLSLNDDGFSAEIECDKISVIGEAKLTTIDLLPFFEAALPTEDGYMLLPDGSGALIDLSNNHVDISSVSVPIYGADDALSVSQKLTYDERATLPVFGMNRMAKGVLAVIENGDALASVCADIAGRTGPVCTIFPSFNILPYERVTLDSVSSKTSYNIYGNKSYKGKITTRYILLNKENCSYAKMAGVYRKHLLKNGKLQAGKAENYPLSVEVLGALAKKKSFLGIEYTKTYPLTTFSDTVSLVNSLKENAIDSISLKYAGWQKGGLSEKHSSSLNALSALGGDKAMKSFNRTMSGLGITCYFDKALQKINEKLINSRINVFASGAKFVYKDIATMPIFDLATAYPLEERMFGTTPEEPKGYLLAPDRFGNLFAALNKSSKKQPDTALCFTDLGSMLYSDFENGTGGSLRQESLESIQKKLTKSETRYAVESGDLYTLKNAELIYSLASKSTGKLLYDRDVPFAQLVLHGSVPYTTDAINLSTDPEEAVLKAVETGAVLHYTFAARNIDELKNSDFNRYYSVSFGVWEKSLYENYHRIALSQKGLVNLGITDHEYLTDSVTKTVYEDGTTVLVNYGSTPYSYGGKTVGEKDFIYIK